MNKVAIYQELYNRNALPENKIPIFNELAKRGLVTLQKDQQIQTEQLPQDESIIQKLLRLDRESAEKAEQRLRERGVEDPDVQTFPEVAKGALNLASYLPVSAPLRLGKYAKGAYELGVPALLGAGAKYIGEREKGQYAEDALGTATKQAGTEIATGAVLSPTLKLAKAGLKKLSAGIPDDLYKEAKQFSQKTSKPLEERIEQIKSLGDEAKKSNQKFNLKMQDKAEKASQYNKKIDMDMQEKAKKAIQLNKGIEADAQKTALEAIKANKKIDIDLQKKAEKASVENKNTARKISDIMNSLSKKFFLKNSSKKLVNQIKNVSDAEMDTLIEKEHKRLMKNAKPLKEDRGIKRNLEAEALLNDFRNRFMVKKIIPETLFEESKEIYSPIKSRSTFFKEMRLISDKSTFGEGKKAVGQSYAKIHKNFNDFLKSKSPEYKEHKELGQLLVNFSKYKPDVINTYDTNKIQKGIKETLDTFDKSPDPDSVKRINDFLKQAKKYKFKTDIDLKNYSKNLEAMQFQKAGTKGLTKEQIMALPLKDKKTYLKNIELSELKKAKNKGITIDQLEYLPSKTKKDYLKNLDLKQFEKSGIKGLNREQIESLPTRIKDAYLKNIDLKQFEKAGIKGLTQDQINALPDKIRKNYSNNQDLAELTKEPLFTGAKKAEQVATDPSKMGRIMELIKNKNEELVKNIEIEAAKREYDALTSGLTASGEIPYVSPFVSKYFLASQIARKGLKSPAIQGYAKKIVEGDTKINPQLIKAGAKLGARALPRQLYGTEKQRIDTVRDPMTGRPKFIKRDPFAIKRQESGGITPRSLQQIKQERGL